MPAARRAAVASLLVGSALALTQSTVQAQATAERVLHVFVEPKDGNDALAGNAPPTTPTALNPIGVSDGCTPSRTPVRPNDYYDTNQANAKLLNAPYPFKTVTAAIAYINALPRGSAQANGSIWKYAIIHCGDGLYAPDDYYTASSNYHPDNGLKANGETFPIELPNYVSIQGTSALNTVFHAGGSSVPLASRRSVFVFGSDSDHRGIGTFIDKVSIYGVAGIEPDAPRSAAIYCSSANRCYPTISNCWIFNNFVGLLLDAPFSEEPPQDAWHEVTLTNNTFAWNQCGIWNGMAGAPDNEPTWGISRLIALNNLIDSNQTLTQGAATGFGLPSFWVNFGGASGIRTCFEGVAREDLTVASTSDGSAGSLVLNRDFNAYEARPQNDVPQGFGGYNWGDPPNNLPVMWLPVTRVIAALNAPMVPGSSANAAVNLSPITGNQSQNSGARDADRGTLYIRDLFYNGARSASQEFEPSVAAFDHCPGDFRLASGEALYTTGATEPNDPSQAVHRLVDAGWYPVSGTTEFPLVMQNGLTMGTGSDDGWPGYLTLDPADQSTWEFHNWNFDCEGIGNARAWDHPSYSNTGYGGIDIGADELGGLIVAGYRFGTTHYFKLTDTPRIPHANVSDMDNRYVWYLGPAGATEVHGRPWWRKQPDENPTVPLWGGQWHWDSSTMAYYFPPLLEITPHLLNDIHPYWAQFPPLAASNPIWQDCNPLYNLALYWDPVFGILNPPGVFPVLGTNFQWLDGQARLIDAQPPTFVDYGQMPWVAPRNSTFTTFDAWCAARTGVGARYDVLAPTFSTTLIGYRYSVEYGYYLTDNSAQPPIYAHHIGPSWARASGQGVPEHNMQSFIVLVEPEAEQEQ